MFESASFERMQFHWELKSCTSITAIKWCIVYALRKFHITQVQSRTHKPSVKICQMHACSEWIYISFFPLHMQCQTVRPRGFFFHSSYNYFIYTLINTYTHTHQHINAWHSSVGKSACNERGWHNIVHAIKTVVTPKYNVHNRIVRLFNLFFSFHQLYAQLMRRICICMCMCLCGCVSCLAVVIMKSMWAEWIKYLIIVHLNDKILFLE